MKVAGTLAAIAILLTLLLFRPTVHDGFDYDDYHFVRPYTAAEVRGAFRGPWDPAGIELPFYRPLTIAFYAARFSAFGLNADAYHALSLALFAAAAMLAGAFAWRLTGRPAAGALAAVAFSVHPAMPYALVAWVTNQMHLLAAIVVLAALLWWHAVRERGAWWWTPLLGLAAIAFLIKEDGVMLLPVVLAVDAVERRVNSRGTRRPPPSFIVGAGLVVVALVIVRERALTGLGGYRLPSLPAAWDNFTRGLNGTFRLLPAKRPWQPAASAFAQALPIAALVCGVLSKRGRAGLLLGATGLILAVGFDLSFVFVTKAEQLHVVATGASFVIAGAALVLYDALPRLRLVTVAVIVAGFSACAAVSADIARDFAPFGPIVRSHDAIVRTWSAVPIEIREYLAAKQAPDAAVRLAANPADALPFVAFGLGGRERDSDGAPFRWTDRAHAVLFVRRDARTIEVPVRAIGPAARLHPHVSMTVGGNAVSDVDLADDRWHSLAAALPRRTGLARMHRVDVVTNTTWSPAQFIPGSTDTRTLGVQIGDVRVR